MKTKALFQREGMRRKMGGARTFKAMEERR